MLRLCRVQRASPPEELPAKPSDRRTYFMGRLSDIVSKSGGQRGLQTALPALNYATLGEVLRDHALTDYNLGEQGDVTSKWGGLLCAFSLVTPHWNAFPGARGPI